MVENLIKPLKVRNHQKISRKEIPLCSYEDFYRTLHYYLQNPHIHCVSYFAFREGQKLRFLSALANDEEKTLYLLSHRREMGEFAPLRALTAEFPGMHIFEREMAENFGIPFENHPWLKPVRYPRNRHDPKATMETYPFYRIEGEELHEVGVGPIHAGVIEPGHFRFTCSGEMVLHLEIQLGWQHRGVETLFLEKKRLLERALLAEQIAGDTAVGHSLAFALAMESLGDLEMPRRLSLERTIALELERIAVHTGDMSALCGDVAYQLGTAVLGVLRTPIINFTQAWCGNRLGKSMIRPGGTWIPLTAELQRKLLATLENYEWRFLEMAQHARTLAGIENRFENIGTLSKKQSQSIGTVGMAARMSGVSRDIRASHPFGAFREKPYEPVVIDRGDVLSRFILRKLEIRKSLEIIRNLLSEEIFRKETTVTPPPEEISLPPSSAVFSLVEGWRGEICHTALTDEEGNLEMYKIKDPSMHNWKALELSLRNLEISDFPINNKSYSLSYCGHDL